MSRRGRLFRSNDRTQSYSNQPSRGRNQHTTSAEDDWDTQSSQTRNCARQNEGQNWEGDTYAHTSQSWQKNAAPTESEWDRREPAQTSWKQNAARPADNWDNNTYAQGSQGWEQNVVPAEKGIEYNYAQATAQNWRKTSAPAEKDQDYNASAQPSQNWKQNTIPAEKEYNNAYPRTRQNVAPVESNWERREPTQTGQSRQNAAPAESNWDRNEPSQTGHSWIQTATHSADSWGSHTSAVQTSQSFQRNAAPAEKEYSSHAQTTQNWRQKVEPAEEHQANSSYSQPGNSQGWRRDVPSGEEEWNSSSHAAQSSAWNKGMNYRDEEPVKEPEGFKPNRLFGEAGSKSGINWNSKPVAKQDNWDSWEDNKTGKASNFSQQQGGSSPAGSRIDTMTFSSSRETRDDYGSRGQQRADSSPAGSNNELKLKIATKFVELIIGKDGCNIRNLQDKSGAKINVERKNVDSSGRTSVMILGSNSVQSEAKRLIEELIESDSQAPNRGDRPNASYPDKFSSSRDSNVRESNGGIFKMEVSSNYFGKIIGKRRCMINNLQVSSGARIRVDRVNNGPITIVSITGTAEAKARAEKLIRELVEECTDYQSKYENSPSQQGRSDSKAPSANRPGWSGQNAQGAQRSGWSEDDAANQGDNGANRSDSWRGPGSPAKNRSQWSGNGASDACGDSKNTNGREKTAPLIDWDKIKEADEEFMKVKWREFPPVKKDFYIEDVDVANLEPSEVERIRKDNNKIMVQHLLGKGGHIPNPIRTFQEAFGHYPEIMEKIRKVGLEKPSPIQMQAWPIILKGQDLIGIAQTGTGRTLAFLLPAFIHIEGQPADRNDRGGANVLVLTPTRELALQIEEEVKKYKYRGIKCVCVYGGGNRKEQINVVAAGVEIMVATPGRLIDLISAKIVDIRSVTYLVLDEADRMLDMGFQPDIRNILLDIRPERQTIMTSATWPVGVRYLATNYMNNPVQVYVGSMDLTACHSVLQRVVMVEEDNKYDELTSLLKREMGENDKVIVFIGRKVIVDYISTQFVLNEIDCQSIHGGREQVDREQALEDLKSGSVRILLATDVASRGIDIKDITHVINYDFPHNIEEYVHRVGRTGRAGRSGQSITFMTRKDWRYAQELIQIMEKAKQEVPQELYDMAARFAANQKKRKAEEDLAEEEAEDSGEVETAS